MNTEKAWVVTTRPIRRVGEGFSFFTVVSAPTRPLALRKAAALHWQFNTEDADTKRYYYPPKAKEFNSGEVYAA